MRNYHVIDSLKFQLEVSSFSLLRFKNFDAEITYWEPPLKLSTSLKI